MTSNDSTTTATLRYGTWWGGIDTARRYGPVYESWEYARAQADELNEDEPDNEKWWQVWDYKTPASPVDVTEANPEGTHAMTPHPGKRPAATPIPEGVHKVTIQRGTFKDSPIYVNVEGIGWHMNTSCTDAEVLTRIHEIAAAMEAVK